MKLHVGAIRPLAKGDAIVECQLHVSRDRLKEFIACLENKMVEVCLVG